MTKFICIFVVVTYLIPMDAGHYHNPQDCLVYNFEKSEDTLEYKVKRLDFLFEDYIGLIQEWETQSIGEIIGKPSFNIGSVGIKPQRPRSPRTLSYGVSRSKIHVVNGGIIQFNLYKESKKLLSMGDMAYVSVIFIDQLTSAKENLTLYISDQQEGWSQPILRFNATQDMVSYIHLFGRYSESVFFYVDAIRYNTLNSAKTECAFYNSTGSVAAFISEVTKTDLKQPGYASQDSAGDVTSFEAFRQFNGKIEEYIRSQSNPSSNNKPTPGHVVKEMCAVEKHRNDLNFTASSLKPNAYNYFDFLKEKLNHYYENNKTNKCRNLALNLDKEIYTQKKTNIKKVRAINFGDREIKPFFKFTNLDYRNFPKMKKTFFDYIKETKEVNKVETLDVKNNQTMESKNKNKNNNNKNNQINSDNANSNAFWDKNRNQNVLEFRNNIDVSNSTSYKNEMSTHIILVSVITVII